MLQQYQFQHDHNQNYMNMIHTPHYNIYHIHSKMTHNIFYHMNYNIFGLNAIVHHLYNFEVPIQYMYLVMDCML